MGASWPSKKKILGGFKYTFFEANSLFRINFGQILDRTKNKQLIGPNLGIHVEEAQFRKKNA